MCPNGETSILTRNLIQGSDHKPHNVPLSHFQPKVCNLVLPGDACKNQTYVQLQPWSQGPNFIPNFLNWPHILGNVLLEHRWLGTKLYTRGVTLSKPVDCREP